MAPFYGWGSTSSRLEPLREGSLLFTTKSPEIPGTHFIHLRRLKGWVNLGATRGFEHGTPGLGIQCLPDSGKNQVIILLIVSFFVLMKMQTMKYIKIWYPLSTFMCQRST